MYPWGHLAVAYLLYSLYTRGRFRRPPRPELAVAVVFGSQLADLIDKPLAWWIGILPSGRSLAHSLIFAAGLIVVVVAFGIALDRVETATAFGIAHLTHLVADLPPRFFLGYPHGTEFLFWPFLSPRTFDYSMRIFESPRVVEWLVTPLTDSTTYLVFQGVLFGLAFFLWYTDGSPGIEYVRIRL